MADEQKIARLLKVGDNVRMTSTTFGEQVGLVNRIEVNVWLANGMIIPVSADSMVDLVPIDDIPDHVVAEAEAMQSEGNPA